tara:strand:+ start:523 stop:1440 length:918 start_codon:yes stop_codon:yes gene_type:complete
MFYPFLKPNIMKNLTTTLLAAVLFTAITTTNISCKKDRIELPEELNEYQSVNDYLNSKKQEEQTFEITGPSNDTIVGNQGTRIYGMKSCLRDVNGDTIDYPFNIHLVELYTPKDMIYWQMPTIANGNVLETDGEVRIRSTKNGQELNLNCPFSYEMPNGSPNSNMTIFKGTDNGTFVDWANTGNSFTYTSYGYLGTTSSFGWLNADIQIANPSSSTISFTSLTDNLTNVGIFIYIPTTKTVIQVYNLTSTAIPNGTDIKVVLMAQDASGQLFSYTESKTISTNTTITANLNATTDTNITTYLDAI